jgi:hypothetical protein
VGKKEEKNKKIHELQLRFSYRLFGMPAERTSFGALADITVTTSYRGPSLLIFLQLLAALSAQGAIRCFTLELQIKNRASTSPHDGAAVGEAAMT